MTVRRAADRFHTVGDGVESWHSFSFGAHYDPDNVRFGALVAHNDERLAPGAGFDEHPHRDLEIVTWVLSGTIEHHDTGSGRRALLGAGHAGHLTTGVRVEHTERDARRLDAVDAEPARFVQIWLTADADRPRDPAYQSADLNPLLAAGGLVTVAASDGPTPLPIDQEGVLVAAARLAPGERVELPEAQRLHAFVATGALGVPDLARLEAGDALRAHDVSRIVGTALRPTEILVVALDS
jgi:redox-sensitive bicupin YhaK (pirin superfamily)